MFVSFISVFTGIRIVTLVTRESTPLVLNLFFPRIIFSKNIRWTTSLCWHLVHEQLVKTMLHVGQGVFS